jgi:hypothetical protein
MYQKTELAWPTLKEYVQKKPDKIYTGISPSSLGGCMRSHYWKIKGMKASTPPTPGALVNFQMGHIWEAMMARAYDERGLLVKWFQDGVDKPWLDEDTGLSGTPDFLVYNSTDFDKREIIINDSKTVNSAFFNYAKTKPFEVWVADNMAYVYQQVSYIILARKNGYPQLDKAVLSFASKDDSYIALEFEITATPQLIMQVKSRAWDLKGYLDRNELPPCSCEGWKVGYCNYGNPFTQKPNTKKKLVNTECCQEEFLAYATNKEGQK